MSLADELLAQSRMLAELDTSHPGQASLRRALSTVGPLTALAALRNLRPRLIDLDRVCYLRLRSLADRRLARRALQHHRKPKPSHLVTGERGEELAWFHLRGLGYTVVAHRWHSARLRGDLDLVAWDGDTLIFFEVKTRTAHDLAPAQSAVDRDKQRMLRRMAIAYRRRLPEPWRDLVPIRFDVLSVYDLPTGPEFEHIRNAFPLSVHAA